MNWPANSKNRQLSTTQHAEHTSFNHGTHGTHGNSWVLTSVYSGVFRGSIALGFLLPCVPCSPWFHGFWVLTSVCSGAAVSLAVLVSCKVLTMVSARSTPAEVVQLVRRTSSPSAKSYSPYDGLPVRRPRRTGGSIGATDFQSVGQGEQNANSLLSLMQPPFCGCKNRIPTRTPSRSKSPKQA